MLKKKNVPAVAPFYLGTNPEPVNTGSEDQNLGNAPQFGRLFGESFVYTGFRVDAELHLCTVIQLFPGNIPVSKKKTRS
jgi:hypothetical protein